jgi:hypothetical protein
MSWVLQFSLLIFNMRNLTIISLIIFLFSCSEKEKSDKPESDNILEDLRYSVDTVLVNSGNEIIDLSRDLGTYDLSPDHQTLYKWDIHKNVLQVISLESLEVKESLPFEPEGPNGVGNTVVKLVAHQNGTFGFNNYLNFAVFDRNGNKLKDLEINEEEVLAQNLESINFSLLLTQDQLALFSLPGKRMEGPKKLARIDPKSDQILTWELPKFDWITEISAKETSGTGGYFFESFYLSESGNKILISSKASSSIYYYDLEKDSIFYKEFDLKLTSLRKENTLKKEYDSPDEFRTEVTNYFKGVNFENPIWDPSRNMYFRFASFTFPNESGEVIKKDIFLTSFDSDLNLLGELKLPNLNSVPSDPFFKDGKLWSYVNVEDELGFAVFTFDF